ncbi:hypothetical protein BGY98DRAFT_1016187, partial [Russula aff. rugulosa BPL654]
MTEPLWFNVELVTNGQHLFTPFPLLLPSFHPSNGTDIPCSSRYHFRCIQLSEDDASEIMVFVCPTCQEKTGRRTVMEWEGLDALEPIEDATNATIEEPSEAANTQTKDAEKPAKTDVESEAERQQRPSPAELSESSDDGSGDEYVEDAGGNRHQRVRHSAPLCTELPCAHGSHSRQRTNNRRIAAVSKAAATGAHARRTNVASTKTKTISTSPQPTTLKRKQSISATGVATASTTAKRKRAESSSTTASATEDATRKYCLGKFSEMFTGIFMQYPYVYPESNGKEEGAERKKATTVERKPEELTEEEKTQLRERASAFAAEVEHAVFDTYAEPDKHGKPGAGVKYKERFRTLTFNLQQSDRVALHRRISSGQVAAVTLSTMSSTELASQEQQESIKQAEQEALEHSILVKTTVPRSKITHKGLQDIEDVNEDSVVAKQRERERDLEMAEQERERERERLARLRTVQPRAHTHSNPPSASVPPESPVVPSSTSAPWDAPPPVPLAQTSDFTHVVDPELNLGDFIHIDDEPPESTSVPASSMAAAPDVPASVSESAATGQGSGQQGQSTPMTGISPFAPNKPDMPPRASFDLNTLWSAPPPPLPPPPPNENDASGEGPEANDNGEAMDIDTPTPPVEEGKSHAGEPASVADPEQGGVGGVEHEGEGGDELDFAMFLGQEEEDKDKDTEMKEQTSRPDPQVVFEGLPHVWNGIISMPTDSTVSQELRVIARQIGGRGLAFDSQLWRTLFPLDHLRIDGRVPVGSSAQYLVASRLNSAKELLAVAWTPVSDADMAALKTVSSFLINKDRHGLIFPWGSRGREWGRELYVIPLLSSHTLPEYIELLDDLHLPQTRSADCLVGIWVLNRGRLNALPPPLPPPPLLTAPPQPAAPVHPFPQSLHAGQPLPFPQPPGQQASALPPALASALASIMPAGASLPNAAPAALAAALSHIPVPPPPVPTAHSSTTAAPAPISSPTVISPTSPAELAAKVASLTPDQIQAMLLTLQQQQQPSSAPPQPPQLLPVTQQSTQMPSIHAPGLPSHLWPAQQTPTMPMQKPYGGHDERERGGGPGRRGGYYGRDESPRGRGRGGGGGRRGGGNAGRDDGRGGGDFRRMSDGGWNGR